MSSIDPKDVPDDRLRQVAELIVLISDRMNVGIAYFVARKTGIGQIDGCLGLSDMDKNKMDAFAGSLLGCEAVQDSISRVEHLVPSKANDRRKQLSVTRFMAKLKEMLE